MMGLPLCGGTIVSYSSRLPVIMSAIVITVLMLLLPKPQSCCALEAMVSSIDNQK